MSSAAYPAHAFHESLGGGRASGELTLDALGFHFRSGARSVTLPYAGARLRLGGAGDRLVFVEHPAFEGWTLYTGELAILRHPALAGHPDAAAARRRRTFGWTWIAAVAVALLALPVALIANMGWLSGIAARQIPPSWETQLGKTAFDQYRLQSKLLDDDRTQALLKELTAPLVDALGDRRYELRFHVALEPRLNAFALPGGYIVLHSALVQRADSAEELLGVLAHEVSHVTEQHGTRNLIASAGIILTVQALLGDAGGLLSTLATAAPLLLGQKYSRAFEEEADERGFALLERSRVDAAGMRSFFEKVKAEEELARERLRKQAGDRAATLSELPEFLSSHPATDSRIAKLHRLAENQRGPYRDLRAPFEALKAHVGSTAAKPAAGRMDESAH